jgi:hypothetical protein
MNSSLSAEDAARVQSVVFVIDGAVDALLQATVDENDLLDSS